MMNSAVEDLANLYPHQTDAMFTMMIGNTNATDIDRDHGRYALWLIYRTIEKNRDLSDKRLIWFMKNRFNVDSSVTVMCLKALNTVFNTVNVFNYKRDQNCKRYNIKKHSNDLIEQWCSFYEETHPEIKLMQTRLQLH